MAEPRVLAKDLVDNHGADGRRADAHPADRRAEDPMLDLEHLGRRVDGISVPTLLQPEGGRRGEPGIGELLDALGERAFAVVLRPGADDVPPIEGAGLACDARGPRDLRRAPD